ncbi:MAG: geranylgeranyl reductase family protein [Dehalococcoidia bacterium]
MAVVGAGPAGAATALHLARAGWDVLLLERERLPRYKVCGGGVTRKALQELPFDPADVLERAPTHAKVAVRSGQPVEIDAGEPAAWTVMRDRFDARIVAEAVSAGARLVEGCRVIGSENGGLSTSAGPMRASYVVGADGAPSRVASSLGLTQGRRQTPAVEAEVAVDPETLRQWVDVALFDFGAVDGGYGWVFPKSGHLSIGLCSLHRKAPGLLERTRRYVRTVLNDAPSEVLRITGHLLPVGGPAGDAHHGNALLVGDAAGLVDPFLGEGIAYALRSARLAAAAIDDVFHQRAEDLSPYSECLRTSHAREFRWADRIGRIVYRHPRLVDRLAFRNRRFARLFFDVLTGERTYRQFVGDSLRHPLQLAAGYF